MTHIGIKKDNYIYFELSGSFNYSYLENLFSKIRMDCNNSDLNNAVIDCRSVTNMFKSDIERFYIGKTIATELGMTIKLAAIIGKEKFNKFGEISALNRGANMKLFSEKEAALDWLLKK